MTLKKLNENEEIWGKEKEEHKSKAVVEVEKVSMMNIHTEGFIFENRLGFPIVYERIENGVDFMCSR